MPTRKFLARLTKSAGQENKKAPPQNAAGRPVEGLCIARYRTRVLRKRGVNAGYLTSMSISLRKTRLFA